MDNECLKHECLNRGRCRLSNSFNINIIKPECVCLASYSGKSCEIKPNPCDSFPCNNEKSSCIPTSDGLFQCICSDEFDGEFCENKIDKPKPHYVFSFDTRSFIQRPSLNSNSYNIYIVFFSNKTEGIFMMRIICNHNLFLNSALNHKKGFSCTII